MSHFFLLRNKIIFTFFSRIIYNPPIPCSVAICCPPIFFNCISRVHKPFNFFISEKLWFLYLCELFYLIWPINYWILNVTLSWFFFNPFISCNLLKIWLCHWTPILLTYAYISFTIVPYICLSYFSFLSILILVPSIFIEEKLKGNSCKPQNKIFRSDMSVALRMMLCK